ncbi:MFS transporter [Nonomuraea zeae]|uniref:MFS transporter n=1 Tax=Nonomuraea zeae TaxID=1642303 RepID=A0A5S4GGU0_9ACTN|nr:MFS transporter [Nonomuraea zeae]TMR31734.1 MFS transporter [Nonomuraea zeae]
MASTPADPPPVGPPTLDSPHDLPGDATAEQPGTDDLQKVGATYIWLIVLANFGVFMALVTPMALSLAIRVSQLAPGRDEYLGYVIGAGGIASVLAAPLIGMLSDRTRSRFGRRRPYLLGLTVLGIVALLVMAQAPTMLMLGLGWVLAQIGWGSILALLIASQADQLPGSQRGKVSGLGGMVGQLAPVAGALLASGLTGNTLLLFLLPGVVGAVAMVLFVLLVSEPDSRDQRWTGEPWSLGALARTYVFDPRQSPDFAWNWLGKFLFMTGLTFNTTFTAYFVASRMGITVEEVGGLVAVLSMGGIVAAIIGAVGGGFLSDKLRRRRVFVILGGCVYAAGAITMALAPGLPLIIAGAVLGNLGIGVFAAVDQAIALDVLPDRANAGRYTGIYNFSSTIAQGVAPLIAPIFLTIGVTGDAKNYTLLYFVAAAFTVLAGLVVLLRVKSVR